VTYHDPVSTVEDEFTKYDVIVIGAGYGGAPLAALLANEGRRVALIDKTPRAGGKTQTLDRRGYRYEMFGAVGIPAVGSRFDQLVDVLDIHDHVDLLVPSGNVAGIQYKSPTGEWRSQRSALQQTGDPEDLADLQHTFGASDADMETLANFYLTVLTKSDQEIEALDDVGMLQFLRPFGLPSGLESQILATMNMLFVVPVDRLAASEGVLALRQVVEGGAGRFHAGGYGQVAEACADFVVDHGGSFVRSTRVDRVVVEGGRAVGVEAGGRRYVAPVVVSNAGIQPTVLRLTGAEHFPPDYVTRVQELEPSWGIAGLRYVLDDRVFDAALLPVFSDQSWLDSSRFAAMEEGEWPDVPLIAIDVASEFDASLVAEPGHQVANIQVFVSGDPDSPMAAEAVRRGREVVNELWPELERHTLWSEPYGPRQISRMTRDATVPGSGGEAVGLAQVVGQVGRSKPDPQTPLSGLYLVGCDAGGRGAGTHQAVDSAFNVAELVNKALG
jgi:phytoene dehydrogenase-like protein